MVNNMKIKRWLIVAIALLPLIPVRVLADTTTTTTIPDSSNGFIFMIPLVLGVGCIVASITFLIQKHFKMMFMALFMGVICFVIMAYTLSSIANLI